MLCNTQVSSETITFALINHPFVTAKVIKGKELLTPRTDKEKKHLQKV